MKMENIWISKTLGKHLFLVQIENCFFTLSRQGDLDIWEIDFKQWRKIIPDDIPKWAQEKIKYLENYTEQFEVKYEYEENGVWKKDSEYIDVNCFKWQENMHEKAQQKALRMFEETGKNVKILSVTFC